MAKNDDTRSEGMNIQSVARAMDILKTIGESGNQATLKEISSKLGLSHSTVHNILRTLKQGGFVSQNGQGSPYSLGYEILTLAHDITSSDILVRNADPFLQKLSEKYNESVNLVALNQGKFEIIYLAVTSCTHEITMSASPGMHGVIHATATGKVLMSSLDPDYLSSMLDQAVLERRTVNTLCDKMSILAELEQIRQNGYAIDREELSETTRCFAAPIRGVRGNVIAAISISFPDNRVRMFDQSIVIRDVMNTAAQISEACGYRSRVFAG